MEHLDAQQELLDRVVEEFVARCRSGQAPSAAEFARRYPQFADRLQEVLPPIVLLEQLRRKKSADAEEAAPLPEKIGDYKILREVGRGGMGVVYEARQESLARPVALKVLPKHSLLDPKRLARFKIEAQAAARLHHSNIVPVFGLFESDGLFFYAMQLIDGQGLHEVVSSLKESQRRRPTRRDRRSTRKLFSKPRRARGVRGHDRKTAPQNLAARPTVAFSPGDAFSPGAGADDTVEIFLQSAEASLEPQPTGAPRGQLPTTLGPIRLRGYWDQVAAIGLQVAEALDYAHQQGILHRDIKPANLLLDRSGTVWITDFGLAKAQGNDDLTSTGDVIGTLQYMAPESLHGKSDARSDVYSLGLTLYELLTFQTPFAETNPVKLLQLVSQHDPVRPRRRNPAIPRDLETIVLKATHREPQARYGSARALAADLRRFLEDRPIKARRAAVVEQAYRWCRRNKTLSALGAVTVGSLILGCVAGGLGYASASRAFERESARRLEAEAAKTEAVTAKKEAEANMQLSFGALRKTFEALAEHQPEKQMRADRPGPPGAVPNSPPGLPPGSPSGQGQGAGPSPPGGAAPVRADEFDAKLLATMLTFYGDLARRKAPSPELKEEAAKAFTHLADVYGRLGKTSDAVDNYRSAADVYAAIRKAKPTEPRFTVAAAEVAMKWAALPAEAGASPQSLDLARQADAWAAQLRKQFPQSDECRDLLARTQWAVGRALMKLNQPTEAAPRYQDAIELQRQSVNGSVGPPPKFENLLAMQSELAHLLAESHKPDEAIAVINASAAAMKRVKASPDMMPMLVKHFDEYAILLAQLGDVAGGEAMGRAIADLRRGHEPPTPPRRDGGPESPDHRPRPRGERSFADGTLGRRAHEPAGHGSGSHEPPDRGPGDRRPADRGPADRTFGDHAPGEPPPGGDGRRRAWGDIFSHGHGPRDRSPRAPGDGPPPDEPEGRGPEGRGVEEGGPDGRGPGRPGEPADFVPGSN